MPRTQIVTVTPAESGQKLLQFLERRLGGVVPRSAVQRWIRKGQVRVDKGRAKPFDRVAVGQAVRIPPYAGESGEPAPLAGPLTIVHKDDRLLAIAKPAGLAVHGGDGIDDSVAARLAASFADADFAPTLAHRLDRDTSGLLLAARTYETLRELNERFASGRVDKLYLAWVLGRWPEPDKTLLEDRLEKCGEAGSEKVRTGSGKVALAEAVCLVRGEVRSLLAVRLFTGRTHQIRVQLASRGHPVAGDGKYGPSGQRTDLRLHCFALRPGEPTLTLPPPWSGPWAVTGEAMTAALALLDSERQPVSFR
ncbi:RluA family pseudouridine synthase [Pseudodesulfovibrio sp. F-1]|uniref:Ribosomal large subunit pseudouridine synthase C n=1 Tax=Pseudodesulfovibrio alkaliphilus TaxID=2661613 RepID=A0A7K1KNU7_9BACT|nr:RluA family pseudouridine synthase [Pseudodesulfovibrio alkaliphilus]MUM77759.1 RluA family pseudouridine synthase [Pseudodesulfovibrio alkaliphilus]